jgi:hypothetical protein
MEWPQIQGRNDGGWGARRKNQGCSRSEGAGKTQQEKVYILNVLGSGEKQVKDVLRTC